MRIVRIFAPALLLAASAASSLHAQLATYGPGYLGAITLEQPDGSLLVRSVLAETPAARAGIQSGDLILAIDQRAIDGMEAFSRWIRHTRPGENVAFDIRRDREVRRLVVTLGNRPATDDGPFPNFGQLPGPPSPPRTALPGILIESLGVYVVDLDAKTGRELQVPTGRGALVMGVAARSPAASAGLPAHAVIVGVNRRAIDSSQDLIERIREADRTEPTVISFYIGRELRRRRLQLAVAPRKPAFEESGSRRLRALLLRIERLEKQLGDLQQRVEDLERDAE